LEQGGEKMLWLVEVVGGEPLIKVGLGGDALLLGSVAADFRELGLVWVGAGLAKIESSGCQERC
jgi:hypothetical protein